MISGLCCKPFYHSFVLPDHVVSVVAYRVLSENRLFQELLDNIGANLCHDSRVSSPDGHSDQSKTYPCIMRRPLYMTWETKGASLYGDQRKANPRIMAKILVRMLSESS